MNFDGSSSFRCVRFAFVVAGGFAKLVAGRALPLSGSAFPRLGRTSFAWRTKRTPQSTLLTIYR
jgi:hypothetical protein